MNDESERSGASAGSVANSGPVAWAVVRGEWYHGVYLDESPAVTFSAKLNEGLSRDACEVVPLYRSPSLTDAGREAIWAAHCDYGQKARRHHTPTRQEIAAALAAVLERLK